MEMLADTGRVVSAEFVETNPILDHRNGTAALGVELPPAGQGSGVVRPVPEEVRQVGEAGAEEVSGEHGKRILRRPR